jgi:hypothetical protein
MRRDTRASRELKNHQASQHDNERRETVRRGVNSPGEALDAETRGAVEARFGHDFRDVRVHREADEASEVGAAAFTVGQDIVFAPDQYAPNTPEGAFVLMHELTHVMQADRAGVPGDAEELFTDQWDGAEVEAEQTAALAMAGGPVDVSAVLTSPAAQFSLGGLLGSGKKALGGLGGLGGVANTAAGLIGGGGGGLGRMASSAAQGMGGASGIGSRVGGALGGLAGGPWGGIGSSLGGMAGGLLKNLF